MTAETTTEGEGMTTYHINVRRYYYGPRETVERLVDNETGRDWHETYAEARTKIAELAEAPYELSHNEYSRPTYRIARD